MSLMQIAILALVFFAASGVAAALFLLFARQPLQARLQQAGGDAGAAAADPDAWQEKLASALSPASKLSLPAEQWHALIGACPHRAYYVELDHATVVGIEPL